MNRISVELRGGPADGQLLWHRVPDDQLLPIGVEILFEELVPLEHFDKTPWDAIIKPRVIRHRYRITKKSYRGHWLAEYQ